MVNFLFRRVKQAIVLTDTVRSRLEWCDQKQGREEHKPVPSHAAGSEGSVWSAGSLVSVASPAQSEYSV